MREESQRDGDDLSFASNDFRSLKTRGPKWNFSNNTMSQKNGLASSDFSGQICCKVSGSSVQHPGSSNMKHHSVHQTLTLPGSAVYLSNVNRPVKGSDLLRCHVKCQNLYTVHLLLKVLMLSWMNSECLGSTREAFSRHDGQS